MSDSTPATAAGPRYVMDGFGNIWQRFNDVGYVRLVTAGGPAFKTVEELAAWVGPVATLETPNDDA